MKLSILMTGCALSCLAASAPALAQSAQPAKPTLLDIVVAAQRRSENLQRAAIAVSAVSGDALAAARITRPTELGSRVPSLQVTPSSGPYNLFYLRGVGNFQGKCRRQRDFWRFIGAIARPNRDLHGSNELAQGYGKGGAYRFTGSFIPFAQTQAERLSEQVAQGWLLADDAEQIVGQAEASDVLR